MSRIQIIQLNQQKAFAAAVELNKEVAKFEKYICLVTEPYKNKCKIAARPAGSRVIVTKSVTPPRAAIIYKSDREVVMIESLSNEDCFRVPRC